MHVCKNKGCRKSFKWAEQLKTHKAKCDKEPPAKKYTRFRDGCLCSGCEKIFRHQANITAHLKVCKGKARSEKLYCPKCPKIFEFDCRLKAHLLSHKELTCPKCQRNFKRVDHFEKHVASCQVYQEPDFLYGQYVLVPLTKKQSIMLMLLPVIY